MKLDQAAIDKPRSELESLARMVAGYAILYQKNYDQIPVETKGGEEFHFAIFMTIQAWFSMTKILIEEVEDIESANAIKVLLSEKLSLLIQQGILFQEGYYKIVLGLKSEEGDYKK